MSQPQDVKYLCRQCVRSVMHSLTGRCVLAPDIEERCVVSMRPVLTPLVAKSRRQADKLLLVSQLLLPVQLGQQPDPRCPHCGHLDLLKIHSVNCPLGQVYAGLGYQVSLVSDSDADPELTSQPQDEPQAVAISG